MFRKNKLEKQLLKNLEQLNFVLSKNRILELSELLGDKKKLLVRNLIELSDDSFTFPLLQSLIIELEIPAR